ncbi:hypothetical protein D3C72_1805600 [compost metagenome]
MEAGSGALMTTPVRIGASDVGASPMIVCKALRLLARSLMAANSCATTRSYAACASCVSVIVCVPTSKLRLADANCSVVATFCACVAPRLSCALSTSKYACATRVIRSCWTCANCASAIACASLLC